MFCSGGRDQVVHMWNLAAGTTFKTVPVFEVLWSESLTVKKSESN